MKMEGSGDAYPGSNAPSLLAEGLVETLSPPLDQITQQLQDLHTSQSILLKTLRLERSHVTALPDVDEDLDVLNQVPEYIAKVKQARKDMDVMTQKMERLKQRAVQLEAKKHRRIENDIAKKKADIALEHSLAAKPSQSLLHRQQQAK
eukprot:TRINITY_DN3385_c0_g1_i1.p1 TRINITY_DN3385_c0_g1~~TRINITY_DN3385_c0_g1_i1.p1  ORF type:complete len:148 (+),score=46.92 TRINITY_DN3385_c0_g1_i1:184-627(+)